jgi:hypothetical protein
MKKRCFIALAFALSLAQIVQAVTANTRVSEPEKVTLYSSIKHPQDLIRSLFNFKIGKLISLGQRWDLDYGSLYVGDDFDWFSASTTENSRSVIKDMGAQSWTDSFEVPLVEPFPKLKEGESRHITVDASGADGKDGADGADGDGRIREKPPRLEADRVTEKVRQEKYKVDPVFVKTILNHMYVIHVVDADSDYYALFRVDALEKGDNCTISWKLIPSPEKEVRKH